MISIQHKEECCGCGACFQICPKKCITMLEDEEGFLYPKVNASLCIECGLCEKVCPFINPRPAREPLNVYAAVNKDEKIREQSSSGGVFSLLAESVINEGGVVFGARFDDEWNVEISYACDDKGVKEFRGSKYVQANTKETFKSCEEFLKAGRKVLFTGTPCQIAGLKSFLRKDYENLLTCDVICHGAPSPGVWQKYLLCVRRKFVKNVAYWRLLEKVPFCSSLNKLPIIKGIRFRDKSEGWKKFRFVLELAEASAEGKQSTVSPSSYAIDEVFHENIFMKAFLHNMILRPSCYKCKARSGSSGSDITIADFWGIEQILPSMDDDRGTSLVVVNTSKGKYALDDVSSMMKTVVTDFQGAISNNPSWNESSYCHPSRSVFFRRLNKSHDIIELIKIELTREQRISLRHRIKQSLKRVFLCGWIKRFFDR